MNLVAQFPSSILRQIVPPRGVFVPVAAAKVTVDQSMVGGKRTFSARVWDAAQPGGAPEMIISVLPSGQLAN